MQRNLFPGFIEELGLNKQNLRLKFLYILSRINFYFKCCNVFEPPQAPPALANQQMRDFLSAVTDL
jgi:hypothetical protein